MDNQTNETGDVIITPELDLKLNPEDAAKVVEKSAKPPKKKKGDIDDADGANTEDGGALNTDDAGNSMGNDFTTREMTIEGFTDEMLQKVLASPVQIEVARKIVFAADALEAEKNKPAPPTAEEMEAASYSRLVAKYGKDYVLAKKGANQTYFNRATWNSMGKNKMGWVEQKTTMPELQK